MKMHLNSEFMFPDEKFGNKFYFSKVLLRNKRLKLLQAHFTAYLIEERRKLLINVITTYLHICRFNRIFNIKKLKIIALQGKISVDSLRTYKYILTFLGKNFFIGALCFRYLKNNLRL